MSKVCSSVQKEFQKKFIVVLTGMHGRQEEELLLAAKNPLGQREHATSVDPARST